MNYHRIKITRFINSCLSFVSCSSLMFIFREIQNMNHILFPILFSILIFFSMMNHSFQSKELKSLNRLPKSRNMVSPIRTPPRLGKRYNKFSSVKSNFIDKLIKMKWTPNNWKKEVII